MMILINENFDSPSEQKALERDLEAIKQDST